MNVIGAPSEFWITQWKLGSSERPIVRRAGAHDVKQQISGRKKRAKSGSRTAANQGGKKNGTFNNIKLPSSADEAARKRKRDREEDDHSALSASKRAAVDSSPSLTHGLYPVVSEITLQPELVHVQPQPCPVMPSAHASSMPRSFYPSARSSSRGPLPPSYFQYQHNWSSYSSPASWDNSLFFHNGASAYSSPSPLHYYRTAASDDSAPFSFVQSTIPEEDLQVVGSSPPAHSEVELSSNDEMSFSSAVLEDWANDLENLLNFGYETAL